jgi:hypothetical protein
MAWYSLGSKWSIQLGIWTIHGQCPNRASEDFCVLGLTIGTSNRVVSTRTMAR